MLEKSLPHELFDGRTKLLPCQKERLSWMRDTYDMSYRALGKYYNISASQAYYICNPDAAKRKGIKWCKDFQKYYTKEKERERRSKNRNKKKKIKSVFNA